MNPNELIAHWGYLAIAVVVVLGNVGLPVPEETILALGGYLSWQGKLRVSVVLGVGILSAAAGDNLGYWVARRYGQRAVERLGGWLFGGPKRVETARAFLAKRGAAGVFLARFVPGIRFAAGPISGALGIPVRTFMVANALGAAVYVPVVVAAGYAIGFGLGPSLEPLRHVVGEIEYLVLGGVVIATAGLLAWRAAHARRERHR